MLGQKFVSVIKINGKPILPPVMTESRMIEMRQYRNLAKKLEEELKAKLDETIIPLETEETQTVPLTETVSPEMISEMIPEMIPQSEPAKNIDEKNLSITLNELKIDTVDNDASSEIDGFSASPRLDPISSIWSCFDDSEEIISMPAAIIVHGIGEIEQDNSIVNETVDLSPQTPLTEVESCPSLASTELGKYMDISPEEISAENPVENPLNQYDRTESSSTCSTVKETEFTPESNTCNKSISCEEIIIETDDNTPTKKHVRRSSYTLDNPSPALTAQVDSYKERGMTFPEDMCSIRRMSLDSVSGDNVNDSTKKINLNRYLQAVARVPLIANEEDDEKEFASFLCLPTFEDLIEQHDNYFKQLRSQLMFQYKDQMAQLLKRQREEEAVIANQIEFGNDFSQASQHNYCNVNSMKAKFDRVSAAVKGYLTRRLLRTDRVQEIIKTIRDTLEFALNFNNETPIKMGRVTPGEATLHQRILQQLTSSCHEFHDVFFKLSIPEKMEIIFHDRAQLNEKASIQKKGDNLLKRNLSTATLKVLERKKVKLQNDFSNNALSLRDKNFRSKSAFSLRSKRNKGKSDVYRISSGKGVSSPRTSSPRFQRFGARSSMPLDRLHRSARRNLSNVYPQDGNLTFRM